MQTSPVPGDTEVSRWADNPALLNAGAALDTWRRLGMTRYPVFAILGRC